MPEETSTTQVLSRDRRKNPAIPKFPSKSGILEKHNVADPVAYASENGDL